jgi:hypothetical protein
MKLHWGPPPESPDFQPALEGWTALREPSPTMLNLIAGPIGFSALFLVGWGWVATGNSPELSFNLPASFLVLPHILLTVIGGFLALVAVHEMVHALGYPRCGWTTATLIGVWPRHLLFVGTGCCLYTCCRS